LASFTTAGGRIRGIRQGLTIGINTNPGGPPVRPLEMWVQTPDFRFQDGNVSWHLIKEQSNRLPMQVPPTDTQNWAYLQSRGPAMVYKSFTNDSVLPNTEAWSSPAAKQKAQGVEGAVADVGNGQPLLYYVGLTSYTPPDVAARWEDVGGLKCFYDLRFPWKDAGAWHSVDIPIDQGFYSFYASIQQTDPASRIDAAYPADAEAPPNLDFGPGLPEEAFIANFASGDGTGVVYWRVMGSLIVEDKW